MIHSPPPTLPCPCLVWNLQGIPCGPRISVSRAIALLGFQGAFRVDSSNITARTRSSALLADLPTPVFALLDQISTRHQVKSKTSRFHRQAIRLHRAGIPNLSAFFTPSILMTQYRNFQVSQGTELSLNCVALPAFPSAVEESCSLTQNVRLNNSTMIPLQIFKQLHARRCGRKYTSKYLQRSSSLVFALGICGGPLSGSAKLYISIFAITSRDCGQQR